MSTLPGTLPGHLSPQMILSRLDGYDLYDMGRKGLYLAITLVLAQSIYVGLYRCMSALLALIPAQNIGLVLT